MRVRLTMRNSKSKKRGCYEQNGTDLFEAARCFSNWPAPHARELQCTASASARVKSGNANEKLCCSSFVGFALKLASNASFPISPMAALTAKPGTVNQTG